MINGWISLHRKIINHDFLKNNKPVSKFEAWILILIHVNFEDKEVYINRRKTVCKRGESLMSLESWGKIFNWDKNKVKRYFKELKDRNDIDTQNETQTTRLSVCNYESYQNIGNANDTQTDPAGNAKRPTNDTQSDTQTERLNLDNSMTYKEKGTQTERKVTRKVTRKTTPTKQVNNNNIMFETFWNLYDKKKSKPKCLNKFEKLGPEEIDKIFLTLPSYISSTPDKQFRKDPLTYLNQQSWEDEILTDETTSKYKPL